MRVSLFFLATAAAWAQVAGPSLGLVPDGSLIRQMYGIVGAGAVGGIVDTGGNLGLIAVTPRQNSAVATAASTGEVLWIQPGRAAVHLTGVAANPDRIVMSPSGSAAALWFASTSHFQIVSGLPGAAAVRELDATFLGAPVAFAVSDDGNWLAGAWPMGVYTFGPDSAVNQIQPDGSFAALAFYSGSSKLALASPTRILTSDGNAISLLYDGSEHPLAPVGIGTSSNNRQMLVADASGALYSIDLTTGAATTAQCECSPEGVTGLAGSAFRLTSPPSGAVKLFDATTGAVSNVPIPMIGQVRPPVRRSTAALHPAATTAAPSLTISGLPATTGFEQLLTMTISMSSPQQSTVSGTATLSFASSVGGDDQLIQFVSGSNGSTSLGRSTSFAIPAGSTQTTLSIFTGTVAGAITVNVTGSIAGGAITPPAPVTITTSTSVPFISTLTLSQGTGTLSVVITGFSSTRDMVSGAFTFAPATNSTLAQSTVTVPLNTAFATWYSNTAANAFGSEFTLTVPFTVTGNAADIVAVTATLTNSKGTSNPVSQ